MNRQLSSVELEARLSALDAEMRNSGTPLTFRPLESFKSLYGNVSDDERSALFDPIIRWFIQQYGNEAVWDGVVGRLPVIVRDTLYLVRVPFSETDLVVKLTDEIENLPKEIAANFRPEEFDAIGRIVTAGSEALLKLYNLHCDDHILSLIDRQVIRRARFDLEHAAISLRQSGDTQNTIFHTHEAAEKFLKVALMRCHPKHLPKRLGHDLRKIFDRLVVERPPYEWLRDSVTALQDAAPTMNIRYVDVPRSVAKAVSCFHSALSICGSLAGLWLLEHERGWWDAEFTVGKFYIDSARRTFLCSGFKDKEHAVLTYFERNAAGITVAEMTLKSVYSCLYLELNKPDQLKAIREKYDFCRAHATRRVSPEELRIKITHGAEGSYVTGIRTLEVHRV